MPGFQRIFILISTLALSCQFLVAQVSGLKGKRYILKTDLASPILENGFRLELESVLLRDISVSIDYLKSSTKNSVVADFPQDTASFFTNSFGLKIRSYLNKAIPAPLGVYSSLSARLGRTSINATRFKEADVFIGQGQIFQRDFYNLEDIRFFQLGIGWGYQTILKDRIALDAGWTMVYTQLSLYDYELAVRSKEHGSNLLYPGKYLESYDIKWGISIHASVGILLF